MRRMGLIGLLMRPMGFIGLIGFISLTSCSDDPEIIEQDETQLAISFVGSQAEEESVTRTVSLSSLRTSFKVWAYKNDSPSTYQQVIPGFQVNWINNSANTTTSNTNGWEYVGQGSGIEQTIKYWDFDAEAYRYFAVAPYMNISPTITESPAGATLTIDADATSATKIAETAYYTELWFSNNDPVAYPNRRFGRPVTLTFLQPFAMVRYMFTFTADGVDRTDITARTFAPVTTGATIPLKGTVQITYPLLSGTRETFAVTQTAADHSADLTSLDLDYYESSDANDTYKEHWYTVIPPTSQGAYKLAITIFGKDKEAVVPAQYMQWKPGYQYTYKFKIDDEGGIELDIIQVGINNWTVRDAVEHPVYNW